MGRLGDIMGEEFEEQYETTKDERRQQVRKVDTKTMMEICYEALNNGMFTPEDPRFTFSGENVDHDVLLMEAPDSDIQKFRHKLGDDALSLGMFHLNDLMSCAFQEEMMELVDKIQEGESYIIVGRYEEKRQTDGSGNEDVYYNVNPVRGIVPIAKAKEYADKYEDGMEGASVEEQSAEQTSDEDSSDDDDDMDLDGLDDEDDGLDVSEVTAVFKKIGKKNKSVLKKVSEADEDAMDKVVGVVNKNISSEGSREEILDIFHNEVQEIEGWDEEEEEEEDDLDLGDLDDEEEDDLDLEEDDGSSDTDDSDDTVGDDEETEEEDDDDGGESVEDWF